MSSSSMREARFSTRAERPPMKSTPTASAASSMARARSRMSSRSGRSATQAMGVTETLRLTMGTPVCAAMASVTATSSPAVVVTRRTRSSGVRQPRRSTPSVTVRMSRWSRPTIPTLSRMLVHAQRAAGHRRPSCVAWARCGAWPRRPSRGARRSPCRSRADAGQPLGEGVVAGRAAHVHDQHHDEDAGQDGLREVRDVAVLAGDLARHAGDDAGLVDALDGDDGQVGRRLGRGPARFLAREAHPVTAQVLQGRRRQRPAFLDVESAVPHELGHVVRGRISRTRAAPCRCARRRSRR